MGMAERFGQRRQGLPNLTEVRQGVINRYESKGKIYVYHRPTGSRLPDLPDDHPDMIAAIARIEDNAAIQSQAADLWGGMVKVPNRERGLTDLKPPSVPQTIAFSVEQIIQFVFASSKGDVVYYHHGNLLEDGRRNPDTRQKGRYVALCVSIGILYPRQKRAYGSDTHYFAARTAEPATAPGLPSNVLSGRISPDEYDALHAIDSRQASIATSRAIRDALGITDVQAAAMRTEFIHKGWLTNTRPPELTPLGVSLMS